MLSRRALMNDKIVRKQGNPAILTNVKGSKLNKLSLYGKSTQAITTGAQLFDASKLQTQSVGGAAVTNNGDGSFTVSGSGNLSSVFNYYYDYSHEETIALLQSGKTIKVDQCSTIVPTIVMQLRQSETTQQTVSTGGYTITEDDIQNPDFYIRLVMYGGSGAEIVPGTYKPMVYQDGDGTWEPYTGGKPSPSPEYPQEINSAGQDGDINVSVEGANLWTGNQSYTFERYEIVTLSNSLSPGNYTFSAIVTSTDTDRDICSVVFRSIDQTTVKSCQIIRSVKNNRVNVSTEVDFEFDNIILYASSSASSSEGDTAIFSDIMLNEGSTPLPYQPYVQLQSLTVSTPNGLPGIPVDDSATDYTYQDSSGQKWVSDEIDFARGVYIRRITSRILRGSDEWTIPTSVVDGYTPFRLVNFFEQIGMPFYSTHFQCFPDSLYVGNPVQNKATSYPNTTQLILLIDNNVIGAIESGDIVKFKEWIENQYNNNNGVVIYYILSTPTEEPLSEEEIAKYKALHTFTPNTVVGNDKDIIVNIGYREYRR